MKKISGRRKNADSNTVTQPYNGLSPGGARTLPPSVLPSAPRYHTPVLWANTKKLDFVLSSNCRTMLLNM